MSKLILQAILCALLASALWLAPSQAQAQVKFPLYDPEEDVPRYKGVAFESAATFNDYRHGNLIRVILMDGKQIYGTLVWVDRKQEGKERLFVRTKAGERPMAIDRQNIKAVMVGMKAQPPAKGGIVPIAESKERVNESEIQRIEIMHGTSKTVHYHAPNLSAAERLRLIEIANGENNLMRAEEQGLYTAIIRQEEVAIRREQRNQQELLSQLLYRSLIAPAVLTPHYGYGQIPTDYILAMAMARPTDNGMLKTIQTETPNYLMQARQTYTQLRTRAIYEDNRIVAVVAEE